MPRFAAIDIGTNSVLLLVAERDTMGRWRPVIERAEITRLGRGVDASGALAEAAIDETLAAVAKFAAEARAAGAKALAVSATSAARDAKNGAHFIEQAKARADVNVEIIAGDEEARLSFASAYSDFGPGPLVVLDIGGGSTEFIFGDEKGHVGFRVSYDVGSVRLTERLVKSDPPIGKQREEIRRHLRDTFAPLPPPPANFRLVAVAGTATTVFTVFREMAEYDATRVHGGTLTFEEVCDTARKLAELPLDERKQLKGLQPKRADVIPTGALILETAMERLGATHVRISDRGLRWGLLVDRFGKT